MTVIDTETLQEDRKYFMPSAKRDMVVQWRRYGINGLSDGITEHEIRQWDALERTLGMKGLFVCKDGADLTYLRAAPKPTLPFTIVRTKRGSVRMILDEDGQPMATPEPLSATRLLAYHVVRYQTQAIGICTHADLAHTLWDTSRQTLPLARILDVILCHVNKHIVPEHIECIRGRGYRLVSPSLVPQ